jgi:hypothetical protein
MVVAYRLYVGYLYYDIWYIVKLSPMVVAYRLYVGCLYYDIWYIVKLSIEDSLTMYQMS